MFPLDYTIEESVNGQFIVRVGEDVAGHMSEDAEHPGLWVLEDADGQLVGRHHDQEDSAAFLALRFAAGGQDQQ